VLSILAVVAIGGTSFIALSGKDSQAAKRAVAHHPKKKPTTRVSQIQRIRALDRASTFRTRPAGQIEINYEVIIGQRKLATMNNGALLDLLQVTRGLKETNGDLSRLSPELRTKFNTLTQERFRFKSHHRLGERFLRSIGIANNPLFKRMNPWERTRIYDLAVEPVPPQKVRPHGSLAIRVKRRFAAYALFMRPKNLSEFFSSYQFARAQHVRRINQLGDVNGARVELLSPRFIASTQIAHNAAINQIHSSDVGRRRVKLADQLPRTTDYVIVRQLSRVTPSFRDAQTLAFHVHKHHFELPTTHRARGGQTEAAAYIRSARSVMRARTTRWGASWSQDGQSKQYVFQGSISDGGKVLRPTVMIKVDYRGEATLCTYIPNYKPLPLRNRLP
jgi:hypothetical protein